MPPLEDPSVTRAPDDEKARGFGPVMRADDGTEYQVTEEDVHNALPYVAAFFIAMAAWDFSSHAEWTWGTDHLYFAHAFRMLVRIVGFSISGVIMFVAWRDMRANERRDEKDRASLVKREFVVGKPPRWDE